MGYGIVLALKNIYTKLIQKGNAMSNYIISTIIILIMILSYQKMNKWEEGRRYDWYKLNEKGQIYVFRSNRVGVDEGIEECIFPKATFPTDGTNGLVVANEFLAEKERKKKGYYG